MTYHIDEEASVGTFVGNIITDARLVDVYPSVVVSELRFRFLRRRVTGFTLNAVTGILTTSGRLDREALCGPTSTSSSASAAAATAEGSCLLRTDVAIQPMQFFRIVRVLVYVRDINDNAPQSVYHRSLFIHLFSLLSRTKQYKIYSVNIHLNHLNLLPTNYVMHPWSYGGTAL